MNESHDYCRATSQQPNETPPSGVRVPGSGIHPLSGQMVTATFTQVVTGRLVEDGRLGLLVVGNDGFTRYMDEGWTIEAAAMEEPTNLGSIVEVTSGYAVRHGHCMDNPWFLSLDDGEHIALAAWSELPNPCPVGEQG
jgi:hypothetical protein